MTKTTRLHTRREALSTLGGGAAILAGGLTLTVTGRGAYAAEKKINFITPFGYLIGFAPTLYAVSGGFFKKEGLDVTIQGGKGSAMAVQQVLAKQAMFSRTGGVDLIRAAHGKNAPITAVATVTQASPMFVISDKSAPINGPQDMKGKTIGITSKGGLAENLLNMILEDNGIAAKTINREAVGNSPGAFGLIGQKKISAYIASMGTVVKLRSAGQPIVAWNTDKFAPVPGQVYAVHNDVIKNDPATVMAFLRAVNNSMNALFAADDLMPVLQSMRMFKVRDLKDLKVAELALRAEMELYAAEGKENILRNVPSRWQGAMDRMAKVGLVKAGDASKYYTNEFIDKVKG
jgi:ABC-type nitrate/sulfonate/bicarbonate transport system substrate-binding protein